MKVQTNIKAGADFSFKLDTEVKATGVFTGTITSTTTLATSVKLP
jgi:hypothetical protein